MEEAVTFLEHKSGNILATTGSKEAAKYTALTNFEQRVFLRVLSLPNVVKQCQELGFQGKNLICMQGPFSEELNIAMLHKFNSQYMVTKDSGKVGGFDDKVEAAKSAGAKLIVIGRAEDEQGAGYDEIVKYLRNKFLSL